MKPPDEQTYADIEAMNISEGGKLVGLCHVHLLTYAQTLREPISPAELIKQLDALGESEGIPFSRGGYTRRESYKAAFTSALSEGYLIRHPNWTVGWYGYAEDK